VQLGSKKDRPSSLNTLASQKAGFETEVAAIGQDYAAIGIVNRSSCHLPRRTPNEQIVGLGLP
jgi:hypothetical protein